MKSWLVTCPSFFFVFYFGKILAIKPEGQQSTSTTSCHAMSNMPFPDLPPPEEPQQDPAMPFTVLQHFNGILDDTAR